MTMENEKILMNIVSIYYLENIIGEADDLIYKKYVKDAKGEGKSLYSSDSVCVYNMYMSGKVKEIKECITKQVLINNDKFFEIFKKYPKYKYVKKYTKGKANRNLRKSFLKYISNSKDFSELCIEIRDNTFKYVSGLSAQPHWYCCD